MMCCIECSISVPQSATEREGDKQAEILEWGWIWFFLKTKQPPKTTSAECLLCYSISRASCSVSSSLKSDVLKCSNHFSGNIEKGRRLSVRMQLFFEVS